MPVRDYPFIEIAAHPAIRERFAAGDGIALLSPDIDYVYWANGEAARQFGYDTIYGFLEDEHFEESVLARQILAGANRVTPGRPAQNLVLRLGVGFRKTATSCTLERVEMPGGEPALLLAMPPQARLKDSLARARAMIDGFGETDTNVAVIDRDGNSLAQSSTFGLLGVAGETLEALIADIERSGSRLVKRTVDTANGPLPAAMARISDAPAWYLVFVVDLGGEQAAPAPEPQAEPPAVEEPAEDRNDDLRETRREPAELAIPSAFSFDPAGRPVRFVWKIDAGGRFSEISPEFATTVGPNAADVLGRSFEEVAQVFNLDPEGRISALLHRRDTWSGKTVHWPVQGTALAVPVDLAALPTYSRERHFDGFRGFGIVRVGDAAPDPERLGLALEPAMADTPAELPVVGVEKEPHEAVPSAGEEQQPEPAPEAAAANDDQAVASVPPIEEPSDAADDADPFRGEVPALRIVERPARRQSDKVIDLELHRGRARDGLSKIDQAIFNQIGEELGRRLADEGDTEESEAIVEPASTPAKPPAAEHVAAVDLIRSAPTPAAEPVASVSLPAPARLQSTRSAEPVAAVLLAASAAPAAQRGAPAEQREAPAPPGRAVMTASLAEMLPVALLVHRGETLLHANREFLELTGFSALGALQDAGGLAALFSGEATPGAGAGTLTMQDAGGRRVEVRARLQSVGWADGSALMLALAPVPSAVETRAAVGQEAEIAELRSILETATDGVIILEESGTIRSMNRSASALFDYDAEKMRGKPFAVLFAHESQRAVLDYVSSLDENGVASVLNDGREVIGREASGGFIPLFMTIGRLKGTNGFCAVMRDITQFKRTEEELRSAKRAAETANAHKSEFLARVSHEVRTPLNAIIGFSEMMASERFGPIGSPRYLEYAHDIGRSGRHVLEIVNDLLDISKIEAGQQEMDFVPVALNDALAETVALLQPQANGQRVIIRTSLSAALPDVVADRRSVKQIAINLLSNAIRFTPSGGQIVVSTAHDQSGRVTMRVRDTGVGMSRTELEQAMRPFGQGAISRSRPRGDGTGLGLPLTKAMVEANRAQFSIESTPGEGTLVQVVFPPQRVLAE